MDIFNKNKIERLKKENEELKEECNIYKCNRKYIDEIFHKKINERVQYLREIFERRINIKYEKKEYLYKQEIKQYNEAIRENTDAFIKLSDNHEALKKKYYKLYKGVINMADRDGTGPRARSYKPSKKKGGDKKGDC